MYFGGSTVSTNGTLENFLIKMLTRQKIFLQNGLVPDRNIRKDGIF